MAYRLPQGIVMQEIAECQWVSLSVAILNTYMYVTLVIIQVTAGGSISIRTCSALANSYFVKSTASAVDLIIVRNDKPHLAYCTSTGKDLGF